MYSQFLKHYKMGLVLCRKWHSAMVFRIKGLNFSCIHGFSMLTDHQEVQNAFHDVSCAASKVHLQLQEYAVDCCAVSELAFATADSHVN